MPTTPAQRQVLRRLLAKAIISHDDEDATNCNCAGTCKLEFVFQHTGLRWRTRRDIRDRVELEFTGDPDLIGRLQHEALYFLNIQNNYGAWFRDEPLKGWLEMEESIGNLVTRQGWGAMVAGRDDEFFDVRFTGVEALIELLVAQLLPDTYFDALEGFDSSETTTGW